MAENNYPETFYVEKTQSTPEVKLDKDNGTMEFSGRSLPENVKEFYNPIIEWIDNYLKEPQDSTKVVFNFEYFNTASSKMILDIIEKLKDLHDNTNLSVDWYYIEEDDDMLEAGEDYSDITEIPFNYISYE